MLRRPAFAGTVEYDDEPWLIQGTTYVVPSRGSEGVRTLRKQVGFLSSCSVHGSERYILYRVSRSLFPMKLTEETPLYLSHVHTTCPCISTVSISQRIIVSYSSVHIHRSGGCPVWAVCACSLQVSRWRVNEQDIHKTEVRTQVGRIAHHNPPVHPDPSKEELVRKVTRSEM